jgi:PTS system fructose-specific IIA component/PTS system nitrogen regulatory IIA component
MRLTRYLKEEQIDLGFSPELPERLEVVDGQDAPHPDKLAWADKEAILSELVTLLERSGSVSNRKKLLVDLVNRERKATTGLGHGIALPHVRTQNAKGFAIAIARAPEPGIEWQAVDGEPVRLFIAMVAPNYDDKFYLRVEQSLAAAFARGEDEGWGLREELLEASAPGEVVRLLSRETG